MNKVCAEWRVADGPQQGLKSTLKEETYEGSRVDPAELGMALDEMEDADAFRDVELIDSASTTLMGRAGGNQAKRS